uniref:Uncharacterized protein n=1 Tax=Arundo donax TaxID=35708 RepID=A0A0A8ZUH9_ARUDO
MAFALSSDSANALEDETSKFRPMEEAVRSSGSSISFVGLGWRLSNEHKGKCFKIFSATETFAANINSSII